MVIKTGFRVCELFAVVVFYCFTKSPPRSFTAAVGGKRDRQIYRIGFTFNLRQKKRGGNSSAIALWLQSAKRNRKYL